jgi:hypothetical protein
VRATNSCLQESFLGVRAAGIRQVFTATFTFATAGAGLIHQVWRKRPPGCGPLDTLVVPKACVVRVVAV